MELRRALARFAHHPDDTQEGTNTKVLIFAVAVSCCLCGRRHSLETRPESARSAVAGAACLVFSMWPSFASGHSRELAEALLWFALGVPYGIVLLALCVIGIVFLVRKRDSPTYGRVLQLCPTFATVLYVGIPSARMGWKRFADGGAIGMLIAFSPLLLLTIATVTVGSVLRRAHRRRRRALSLSNS